MAGADRISALPEEVKVSILSLLDVKSAVRTSAIARSWHHLWTHLPCLHLDTFKDRLSDADIGVNSNWIEHVHHLVSSLRGPLLVFKLLHISYSSQSTLLQSLLHLLLQKGVETLHLTCCFQQVQLHLPSFHSLKELRLSGCRVVQQSGFQDFSTLTNLILSNVEISNHDLHFLIHSSRSLTTFRASDFPDSGDPVLLNLSLPLLRHLNLQINNSVEKVSVISAPCLKHVDIALLHWGASIILVQKSWLLLFLGCSLLFQWFLLSLWAATF